MLPSAGKLADVGQEPPETAGPLLARRRGWGGRLRLRLRLGCGCGWGCGAGACAWALGRAAARPGDALPGACRPSWLALASGGIFGDAVAGARRGASGAAAVAERALAPSVRPGAQR